MGENTHILYKTKSKAYNILKHGDVKKIYTQNKLVCEKCFNQCIDFEYNEDIIFIKKNYRRYNKNYRLIPTFLSH
jgi:hypothetical protein